MPAEFEPKSVESKTLQTPVSLLQDAHLMRLAQWADSWAESFRSDSRSETNIVETLPSNARNNEESHRNSPPPSTPAP